MNTTDFLIGLSGTMVLAFAALFWWILRDAWDRNEREHVDLKLGLKEVATEVKDVSRRVDHIILHHERMPPYERDSN